mgnify:FL=1
MFLRIKCNTNEIKHYYENNTSFHKGDSGLDLTIPEDHIILKGELSHKINLGISCEALADAGKNISYYLYPRSSIVKTPLRLSNSIGIIDAGYRGNILAFVDNLDHENDFKVCAGTRLFQICSPQLTPIDFKLVDELSETSRGNGGFGSTGA